MPRRTPLTPIFDAEIRRGAIAAGNTPGTVVPHIRPLTRLVDAADLNGAKAAAAYGNYIIVTADDATDDRLVVVDASTIGSLSVAGSTGQAATATYSRPKAVAVSGDYAVVENTQNSYLHIVDLSTPASPSIVGALNDADLATGPGALAVSGTTAYISTDERLFIVDFSTPASPSTVSETVDANTYGDGKKIAVSGTNIVVASAAGNRVSVVDVSTPASPSVTGAVSDATLLDLAESVTLISATHVAVASQTGHIVIVDISTPASPSISGYVDLSGSAFAFGGPFDVISIGGYVVASGADASGYSSLALVDVTDPANPFHVHTYADTTNTYLGDQQYLGVFGSYIIAPNDIAGAVSVLEIVD